MCDDNVKIDSNTKNRIDDHNLVYSVMLKLVNALEIEKGYVSRTTCTTRTVILKVIVPQPENRKRNSHKVMIPELELELLDTGTTLVHVCNVVCMYSMYVCMYVQYVCVYVRTVHMYLYTYIYAQSHADVLFIESPGIV